MRRASVLKSPLLAKNARNGAPVTTADRFECSCREAGQCFQLTRCRTRVDGLRRQRNGMSDTVAPAGGDQSGRSVEQHYIAAWRFFAVQDGANDRRVLHHISAGDILQWGATHAKLFGLD